MGAPMAVAKRHRLDAAFLADAARGSRGASPAPSEGGKGNPRGIHPTQSSTVEGTVAHPTHAARVYDQGMTQPTTEDVRSADVLARPGSPTDRLILFDEFGDVDQAIAAPAAQEFIRRVQAPAEKASVDDLRAAAGTSVGVDDLNDASFATPQGLRVFFEQAEGERIPSVIDSEVDDVALAANTAQTWPKSKLPADTVYESTQRFTTADRTKLDGIETGATAGGGSGPTSGRTQTQVFADIATRVEDAALKAHTTTRWGKAKLPSDTVYDSTQRFTATDETKLDGIEDGATADQTGAEMVTALSGLSGAARLPASAVRDLPAPGTALTLTAWLGVIDNLTDSQQRTIRGYIDAADADLFKAHPEPLAAFAVAAAQGSIATQAFVGFNRTNPSVGTVSGEFTANNRTYTMDGLLFYADSNDLVIVLGNAAAASADFDGLSIRIGEHIFAISDGVLQTTAGELKWTWNNVGNALLRTGTNYTVEVTAQLVDSLVPGTGLKVTSIDTTSAGSQPSDWRTALGVPEGDDQTAAEVSVDASGFDGNLASTDDTVQKVAQKLDDLVLGSGGGGLTTTQVNTLIRSGVKDFAETGNNARAAKADLPSDTVYTGTNPFTPALLTKLNGIEANAKDDQSAVDVPVSTSAFNNNLSSADSTVQAALNTLDDLTVGASSELEPVDDLPAATATNEHVMVNRKGDVWVNKESDAGHIVHWVFEQDPVNSNVRGFWDFAAQNANDFGSLLSNPSVGPRWETAITGTLPSVPNGINLLRIPKSVMGQTPRPDAGGGNPAMIVKYYNRQSGASQDIDLFRYATGDTTNYWAYRNTDSRIEVLDEEEVVGTFLSDAGPNATPVNVQPADAFQRYLPVIHTNGTINGTGAGDDPFGVAVPFTAAEKATALAGEANVQIDWNAASGDASIINKPTIVNAATWSRAASPTGRIPLANARLWFGSQSAFNALVAASTVEADVLYAIEA